MAKIYETLLNNAISANIAAIEIYNKPVFPQREEIFSILNINAWELLLKAKILADNRDNIESIYVPQSDGSFKMNRTGNFLTVEIIGAINRLGLDSAVAENIKGLVSIRDTAIHFFNDDSITYLVYTLGIASLQNFKRYIDEWFGVNLSEMNFFIMPLAYSYNFQPLRMLDLDTKPEIVANIVRSAIEREYIDCRSGQK